MQAQTGFYRAAGPAILSGAAGGYEDKQARQTKKLENEYTANRISRTEHEARKTRIDTAPVAR